VSEDARIRALRDAYECFNRGDLDGALEFLHTEVEWPDLINNRVLHGRDEVRDYWRVSLSLVVPVVSPTEFFPHQDGVVVLARQRVTSRHGGEEVEVATSVMHQYTFRDGMIAKLVILNSLEGDGDTSPVD
jgi:ketosteroid isomerase-like protein